MEDLKRLIKSFSYAFQGLKTSYIEQHNMRIHAWVAIFTLAAGYWSGLPAEKMLLILALILWVISVELINTAIEQAVDHAGTHISEAARKAKDAAAAAVVLAVVTAVLAGLFLLYRPLTHKVITWRETVLTTGVSPAWVIFLFLFLALVLIGLYVDRPQPVKGLLAFIQVLLLGLYWSGLLFPLDVIPFALPIFLAVFLRRNIGVFVALAWNGFWFLLLGLLSAWVHNTIFMK
ncbi:MAG: diacylglycerol kinase family protein [Candidatus Carbobacillus altaicus]|nr:diacylglycerol kinase family protein [Candidatus Carbobacillus altaicus]